MASTKVLTDQTHRDGSPVRRSRHDIKKTVDPAKVYVEDKLGASNRISAVNKSDASPTEMLLAKEMLKEVKSKRKPPSVVARLMGLDDDLPVQELASHFAKRNLRKSRSHGNLAETNRPLQQLEQHHFSKATPDIGPKELIEYKDVYEVYEEPLRRNHLQEHICPRGMYSVHKNDTRVELVRQKFMETKRLATNENLLHSKEFHEALEVLSSNRDLFLKFLEEPNSVFSRQLNELHPVPAPPPKKRITVLKPIKSNENKGVREARAAGDNEENELVMGKSHQRSHSAEDTFSEPTRIVVLKPTPGKTSRTQARLTPRAAPLVLIDRADFYGSLGDGVSTTGYREVQHDLKCCHWRDESLLSSVYSNGYGGDESSFSRSEADYIDEEGGSLSDSEVVSPVSRHSWDYTKRYNSPYSCSTVSRASYSHSPESSVIREAKKRLSERWATVDTSHEVQLPRRSSTLGEMLSLQVAKKETVAVVNAISSGPSCSRSREDYEKRESSSKNLARSKSVPVSPSLYDKIAVDAESANSEGCKTLKVVRRSDKGKLSLKGKVSSFFFRKSKKLTKEKTTASSNSSDERVEATFLDGVLSDTDHSLDCDERMAYCNEKNDSSTIQIPYSLKDVDSTGVPVSSDCKSGCIHEIKSNGVPTCSRDQFSPTSVIDASFDDNSSNEVESSKSIASCKERVAVPSLAIESVARSLSWDDAKFSSPFAGTLKFSNVDDDDELECYALVQRIISSAGLGNLQLSMVFTGWYLPDCPLDPALCDKFLDRKEEAAESRERRSKQKLLFDSTNMALIETGQDALLSTYPWKKACLGAWSVASSEALGEEIWSHVRDWLYGAESFVANENDNAGAMLERIVQQEVEGRGWMKLMRLEADEITEQIASGVFEELVGEVMEHQFPQQ